MSQAQSSGDSGMVPLGLIEAELSRVLTLYQGPDEALAVRRARMSNLVIFVDDAARMEEIQSAIPSIVLVHPARVICAVLDRSEKEEPIQGSVNAWCTLGGGKQHICSEQVTLRSKSRSGEHLVFAIRGLVTGDLPTNLWWASATPPALAGPLFKEAAEHVQQVIYDSNGWLEPPRGVAATGTWLASIERGAEAVQGWRVASDVNWRRLKFWRRMLTQALDPNVLPGALESITEVKVEHGPHAVVQAWLLVSWLASRLGWEAGKGRIQPGVEILWQARSAQGLLRVRIDRLAQGPSSVRSVRVACAVGGKPVTLRFEVIDDERIAMTPEGLDASPRTMTLQAQPLSDLIARQLSDRERDPVFQSAMNVAAALAKNVSG